MAPIVETKCVHPEDWDGHNPGPVGPVAMAGLSGGLFGMSVAGLAGGSILGPLSVVFPPALIILAFVMAFGFVYGFIDGMCNAWLNNRLICLHTSACAVGWVRDEPESSHRWTLLREGEPFFDDDYNFNLTLAPHHRDDPRSQMVTDGYQGQELVADDFRITSHGLRYDADRNWLHCEIESSRASTTCTVLKALSPLITAALAGAITACIVGLFALCLLFVLLFLAVMAAAVAISRALEHEGSPADVTDDRSASLNAGECVVVKGEHVYDAGHPDAWNEIHPVLHLQKIVSPPAQNIPQEPTAGLHDEMVYASARSIIEAGWCREITKAYVGIAAGVLDFPENAWECHPDLDGCSPRDGVIQGTIRWFDSELQFKDVATLFEISASGPPSPPSPGSVIESPGPKLATGGLVGFPELSGNMWTVPYSIPHAPLGAPRPPPGRLRGGRPRRMRRRNHPRNQERRS